MTNLEYCNEILSIIGNVREANDAIYNLAFDAYQKLGGQESQPSLATIYNELKGAIQIWDNTDSLNITENGTYNLLGKIITVNVQGGSIPNNEIWYTSTDGNIVTPNNTSALPTIVSNTYSAGKGVIKCASDITSIGENAFFDCTNLTSIEIPNSVTSIGNQAFFYCTNLTSIEIPNSVTSIGNQAFNYCNGLTSITIPNNVTSMGNYPFAYCSGLTNIVVEDGNPSYDSRENCNAIIETLYYSLVAGCRNTIIPNSIKDIQTDAFAGCYDLTSIEIPNSVTSIGPGAFNDCSSLSSISYTGTISQWNDITKGNIWNSGVPATVVHCSDGDVEI